MSLAKISLFKKIFVSYVYDLTIQVDLEKLCRSYGVKVDEFLFWMSECPVRKAKWTEYIDTINHENMVKQAKRNNNENP